MHTNDTDNTDTKSRTLLYEDLTLPSGGYYIQFIMNLGLMPEKNSMAM